MTDLPRNSSTSPSDGTVTRARLIASVVLGVLWAVTPAILGFWALAELARIGDWLLGFDGPTVQTASHVIPLYGVGLYALLFMITSGFGLLPTYAQAILGGWVFGFWLGVPAALLGFTGGALIGWVVCRLISRDAIVQWVDRSPKWAAIRHAFVDEGFVKTFGIVALVRIPPNSPFSLTNLAMSAGGVRIGAYLLGTLVGMAPRTAIACGFAAAAASSGSADIQEFVGEKGPWPLLIGAALLIGVFMILTRIGKKALAGVLPDAA